MGQYFGCCKIIWVDKKYSHICDEVVRWFNPKFHFFKRGRAKYFTTIPGQERYGATGDSPAKGH